MCTTKKRTVTIVTTVTSASSRKKSLQKIRRPQRQCCKFAVDLELTFIASKQGPFLCMS